MFVKTHGIVLRTVKYGDDSLIIDLLTREEGRVSAVVRTGSSQKSRMRRRLFQPLAVLDVDLSRTPRSTMSRIADARLAMTYATLPFDDVKLSLAFFVAEFLQYATRDQRADAPLYDFVEQSLAWLDNASRGIANFHLMFMMRLSLFLGFLPDLGSYVPGAFFDLREGVFTPHAPIHPDVLPPGEAAKVQTLMRMSPSNLHLFLLSHHERNRIVDIVLRYYRLHIPQFGDMKTLEVLRG